MTDPSKASFTLAKLQDPFKKTMDTAQKDLKPIYSGLNKYGKALDKVGHAGNWTVRASTEIHTEVQRQTPPQR